MKRFLKTPSCLAFLASWAFIFAAQAQTNTESYHAELHNGDQRVVSVPTPYTPYGNKSELNRYGDDGSAAILEASGVIVWRTSDGVYRTLPDTIYSKPLFVSNSECIIWRNAYDPNVAVSPLVQTMIISYFRVDFPSGVVRETQVPVYGNKVLDTPLITTTSSPYTMVTALTEEHPAVNADPTLGPVGVGLDGNGDTCNLYVYHLSYDSSSPQEPSQSQWLGGGYVAGAETIAVAADGSQVVRLGSSLTNVILWVRNDGRVKQLSIEGADDAIIRPVELSAVRFVFGLARYDLGTAATESTLYNYSRDSSTDVLQTQAPITLPFPTGVTVGDVISLPNFTQKGVEPVFVTQDQNLPGVASKLCVFRLSGNVASLLFTSTIPAGLGMDVAVTRINTTPYYESIALRDQTNHGILWLHNGLGWDQWTNLATTTENYSRISKRESDPTPAWTTDPAPSTNDMTWGRPLLVTPGEIVIWQNALSAPINGEMPPVMVKHYGRNPATGEITMNEVGVWPGTDDPSVPDPLLGTQVFAPFPFTQDPALWMLETGEKLSGNSLRLRRYQLLTPTNVDKDGDGIRGGLEEGPFYVIPGSFTYQQAAADAKRRGGKLASFGTAVEFSHMQTGIAVQQRNGTWPLPELTIPYPLWIGLELDTTWQWADSSPDTLLVLPPDALSNWASTPTNPTYFTRGRLTQTQQWEAVSPNSKGSYLLELPSTNPYAKDSDGDGANDYDELFRLITDPNVPGFGEGTPSSVTFSLAVGKYEGFLTQLDNGPFAGFTLSVTKTGAYTGKITGLTQTASFRGSFSSGGLVNSVPVSLGSGFSNELSMHFELRDPLSPYDAVSNPYRIEGQLTVPYGDPYVFELRRPAYSKTYTTADAGLYTLALPADSLPKEGLPSGDGYLTGSISTAGVASLRGKSSDGQALSWSGSVLDGDFLSFYAMFPRNAGFAGSNLFLRDSAVVDDTLSSAGLAGESDIDGDLRIMRKPVTSGSSQIAGYDFRSGAYGSLYYKVGYDLLAPFQTFVTTANNAVIKFIDGVFSGQDVIATWSTKNVITVPKTQTRTLSAKINTSTGELTGTCQYNDPGKNYANTKGTLAGVVLQKSAEVRGYYLAGTGSGQMLMLPNEDETPAPVTLISPTSKSHISENGATYIIRVTASEPWTVTNPATSWGWMVFPMSGTGNAEIVVTISKNSTNLNRKADLTIAGLTHHIEQKWNPAPYDNPGAVSPPAINVPSAGRYYTTYVTGVPAGSTALVEVPVSWVHMTWEYDEDYGRFQFEITVDPWISGAETYSRSTIVTLKGLPHYIVQSPVLSGN
jgi:hypothetical protein